MTNTAAVKISDAEIRRQAAGQVRDLRALGNQGLYFRFHRSRERGSWYLIHKGKWNLIGSYPELSAAKVAAALPAGRGDADMEALKALGYQGLSMDFAVRGVCADCATGASV